MANTVFSSILDPVARLPGRRNVAHRHARRLVHGVRFPLQQSAQPAGAPGRLARAARLLADARVPPPDFAAGAAAGAPPGGAPRLLSELLVTVAPVLRSHFIYMARKPG
ncbi:hypothetical protein LP419_02995 [Massilia sp. H-1]|nr:hypothetical protein LP419_02995 [Massilia sp. H-1]